MNETLVQNTSWDPLEAANSSEKDVLIAAKKRELKNILKSYVGQYDPMSELIQNAMDAVDQRTENQAKAEKSQITIKIDLKENSFQIVDRGRGFSKTQFRSFLAPSISFKHDSKTRGNKGVGATYIAYGFNYLEIRTKSSEYTYQGRFRGGRDWVEDNSDDVQKPQMEELYDPDPLFEQVSQGTSIKLIFGGKNTRPTTLSWYQANTPEQWQYLLLVKTPLGHINLPEGSPSEIRFDIIVVDLQGNETRTENVLARYKYPHDEVKASTRLSTVKDVQLKAVSESKDPTKVVEKFKNSNGLYDFFSTNDILKTKNLENFEEALVKQFSVTAYGYFAYSTSLWDQLNDVKAKLRKNYRIIKGGLQLSNNHMVQGDLITIPLSKSIGHQNQAHILVHFNGADPDYGRKGFQPELRVLAEKLSVSIVNQLSVRRELLKGDSGDTPDIEKELKVHEWIKMQEDHEKQRPLELKNDHFFLPTKQISVRSEPLSEQDVIVLFNQLLAGGVIRGIRLLSTSQVAQYDGIFRFIAEQPLSNLEFDEKSNPLGVHSEQLTKDYLGKPMIIEYKFSLDGLIREFESGTKSEKDVKLAVFWEFGEEYKRNYSVMSLLDFEHTQHRPHHGLTHILRSANSNFYAVCLKDLMNLLNNSDVEQARQKKLYSEDI